MFGDQLSSLAEVPLCVLQDHPQHLPRAPVVDHHLECPAGLQVVACLLEDALGVRRVMDDAERVHEVVLLDWDERRQLLRVPVVKRDPVGKTEYFGALLRDAHRLVGQLGDRHLGAVPREIDGVGADPASDLEHAPVAPTWKFGEAGNVGLDKVLASLDLVEVLLAPDGLRRVSDVAGPAVPVLADLLDRDVLEACVHRSALAAAGRISGSSIPANPQSGSLKSSGPCFRRISTVQSRNFSKVIWGIAAAFTRASRSRQLSGVNPDD